MVTLGHPLQPVQRIPESALAQGYGRAPDVALKIGTWLAPSCGC